MCVKCRKVCAGSGSASCKVQDFSTFGRQSLETNAWASGQYCDTGVAGGRTSLRIVFKVVNQQNGFPAGPDHSPRLDDAFCMMRTAIDRTAKDHEGDMFTV
eukprot:353543-Chlamydomonas_euryale.AAC.5